MNILMNMSSRLVIALVSQAVLSLQDVIFLQDV